MKRFTTADFQRWGASGGRKSRRVLTSEQAKELVAARERKRHIPVERAETPVEQRGISPEGDDSTRNPDAK